MKRNVALSTLLLALASACASSLSNPSSDTSAQASLLGTWTVEFRLDSVRTRDGSTSRWQAASFATTRGTLQLSDSTNASPNVFASRLDVSFDSLLGRPMSCFDPSPTTTGVTRDVDQVSLRFTPHAADCGFGASGTLRGDSLVGTWDESGFAGPQVMGRFRMVRAKQ